jgi:hypothetical protein
MLDVSETGVRLVVKQALPESAEIGVEFEPAGGRSIRMEARVIWTLPLADGTTCIGAELSKRLSYPQLAALART